MLKEFKAFIMRGNVLDLAVAVVIGAAFGLIVTSFVSDIIMPPIGLLLGRVDFKDLFVPLNGQTYPSLAAAKAAGAPVVAYGNFLNTIVNFLIISFAIFLVIKSAQRFQKPAEAKTKDCQYCAMPIPIAAQKCPHCTSNLG
jgi:large conductance mechanosensitive channel